MKLNHTLMDNNFTKSDMDSVIKLVKKKNIILTQSKNVKEFEKKWSKWVGTKYSLFVNSGSSANFITISALKTLNKNKNKNFRIEKVKRRILKFTKNHTKQVDNSKAEVRFLFFFICFSIFRKSNFYYCQSKFYSNFRVFCIKYIIVLCCMFTFKYLI